MNRFHFHCGFLFFAILAQHADAQNYQLAVPGSSQRSTAVRTASGLQVTDSSGRRTDYVRDRKYDSPDGKFMGYYSQGAGQVLGFPVSESGSMAIGSLAFGRVTYRPSRMQVTLLGNKFGTGLSIQGAAGRLRIDAIRKATYLRFATLDTNAAGWELGLGSGGPIMGPRGSSDHWMLVPMGNFYRIQCYSGSRVYSLGCDGTRRLALGPTRQTTGQLWYVSPSPAHPGAVVIESVAYPGRCLAGARSGLVNLQAVGMTQSQAWYLNGYRPPPTFLPSYRFVSHSIQTQPATRVTMEFANLHRRELWVLVQDQRPGGKTMRIKIPAGKVMPVELERQGGGVLVETVEIRSPLGTLERQEFRTPIPARGLFDVSVYELIAQSISIDATPRGGGRIDDVNYQPKSLGFFPLPADLKPTQLDVYDLAIQAKNPGGVRRIDPAKWVAEAAPLDPIERLLKERATQK